MVASRGYATLVQLPDDALALVALRVVRNGEAYWLAAASRSTRAAVKAACLQLRIDSPTSRLSTTFTSLPRLRAGMRLPNVSRRLLAQDVPGAENLPESLDKRYRWSPSACHAMLAEANADVLNYVWPEWHRSANPTRPACALIHICEMGRTDLLEVMYAQEPTSLSDTLSLSRLLRLAVDGLPAACDRVLNGIMMPAVRGASPRTGEWLYSKLEEIGESIEAYSWRTWLSDQRRAGVLVTAACKSSCPFVSLRLLTEWMMPRFASRAPTERMQSMDVITQHVLLALVSGNVQAYYGHHVWAWLSDTWPLGLAHLLRHVHETEGPRIDMSIKIATAHRNCLRVRDLATYQWMREHVDNARGWMREAICCEQPHIPWTVSRELVDMAQEAQRAGPRFGFAYHVFWHLHGGMSEDNYISETRHRWAVDRSTVVESYSDMLLYDTDDRVDTSTAAVVMEVSISAFADALKLFRERAEERRYLYVVDAIMPVMLQQLQTHERHPQYHREPDDSDDGEQRSAAWHYISSLRQQYSRDKPKSNGGR
jgi:hypothetical protein